jgi:hypothetical protein
MANALMTNAMAACMADTKSAAFSNGNAVLSTSPGDEGLCDGRTAFHGSNRTQPAAGNDAALVLQEPFPRHTGRAPLRGLHGFVRDS